MQDRYNSSKFYSLNIPQAQSIKIYPAKNFTLSSVSGYLNLMHEDKLHSPLIPGYLL